MKKKYLTMAAVATMFAACSQNDEIVPKDSLKDTPITVTAGVAELSTRAGYETPEEGDAVLPATFYLSIDQEGTGYDYTNVQMTKGTGNAYTPASQLLWADDEGEVKVTAATFPLTGAQTLEVKTDQSTDENVCLSDHLLMSETSVTPSADGISVAFDHIMSKVQLTITLGDEFNEATNPITGVTFQGTVASNNYTVGTGWATIADGATTADITAWEGTYTPIDLDNGIERATAEYEVILVPQTVAADAFTVQFKVGDRKFKWTSESDITLADGTRYTLELTAGKDKVSGAKFTAVAWNTGEGDNNKLSGETE